MDLEKEQPNMCIDMLIYKGNLTFEITKYLLLEKLIKSIEISSEYNISDFDNTDTKLLIAYYSDICDDFKHRLHNRYIHYYENDSFAFDESNYYKMLRATRKPNKFFINALNDVILTGYCVEENNSFSFVEPLESFSDNKLINSACHYIQFCYAVSFIRKEKFQAYDIDSGNKSLLTLTTDDLPIILSFFNHKLCLSKYIHYNIDTDDFSNLDDYCQSVRDDLYAPMPYELPRLSFGNYITFNKVLSEGKTLLDAQPSMSYAQIIWLSNYCSEDYSFKDTCFHQLLFLLSFVSETTLDKYMNYVPSYNLNIPAKKIAEYYSEIKSIIDFPLIPEFLSNDSDSLKDLHIRCIKNFFTTTAVPSWIQFTLSHLCNKQIQTAKYLYLTLILRKRYHSQKDNDSFPPELLTIFSKDVTNLKTLLGICGNK